MALLRACVFAMQFAAQIFFREHCCVVGVRYCLRSTRTLTIGSVFYDCDGGSHAGVHGLVRTDHRNGLIIILDNIVSCNRC